MLLTTRQEKRAREKTLKTVYTLQRDVCTKHFETNINRELVIENLRNDILKLSITFQKKGFEALRTPSFLNAAMKLSPDRG
jgi:hypothetical protein